MRSPDGVEDDDDVREQLSAAETFGWERLGAGHASTGHLRVSSSDQPIIRVLTRKIFAREPDSAAPFLLPLPLPGTLLITHTHTCLLQAIALRHQVPGGPNHRMRFDGTEGRVRTDQRRSDAHGLPAGKCTRTHRWTPSIHRRSR